METLNKTLIAIIECINKHKEINTQEIAKIVGFEECSIWRYIYLIEGAGYVYRHSDELVLIDTILLETYTHFSKRAGNEIGYYKARLDRVKGKPLISISDGLSILDCLYLLQDGIRTITSKEFELLTNKKQASAGVIFSKLVQLGYMRREGLQYTLIKDVPVIINQSKFLKPSEYKEEVVFERPKVKSVEKTVVKEQDLSWINRLVSEMYFETQLEKINAIKIMKEAAVCI